MPFIIFDLVKFLMHNRKKIAYCTRLQRAKDEDEKKKIMKGMIEDAKFKSIIDPSELLSTFM